MKLNILNNTTALLTLSVASLLVSPSVYAHGGHSHTQFDSLNGILHALSTHPLMVGTVVMIFGIAVIIAPPGNAGNKG